MRASLEFDSGDSSKKLSRASVGSIEDLRVLRPSTAFLHIVKGNFGPGSLALPLRFALVGLPVGLACLGVVVTHCFCGFWLLLLLQKRLDEDEPSQVPRSFEDVGFAVMGIVGRTSVQLCVACVQLGVCIIFLSFLSVNISAALPELSYYLILALVVAGCSLMAFIPNMEVISPFAFLGNIVMVVAVLSTVVVSTCELMHPSSLSSSVSRQADITKTVHSESPLSFLACVFFSFEGVGLVLPIGNSLRPESADNYPKILYSAMSFIAIMFALVGSTGATTFTTIDTASVTAFLVHRYEKGSNMATYFSTLNVFVAVSVFLTYPLQLMPVAEVMSASLGIRRRRSKVIVRLACTGVAALIVLVLPKLGILIKINGAAFCTTLGALPFIFHGAYIWSKRKNQPDRWMVSLILDALAVFLCCTVLVVGVQSAIDEITTPVGD